MAPADLEEITQSNEQSTHDTNLKDLGFVLLECMEGRVISPSKRSISFIAEQRAANKVFGLTNAEQCSGCKEMIDFLDEIFYEHKTISAKFSNHVIIQDGIMCIKLISEQARVHFLSSQL